MYSYYAFGYTINSENEIAQLQAVEYSADADVRIYSGRIPGYLMEEMDKAEVYPIYRWGKGYMWIHNSFGYLTVEENGDICFKRTVGDSDLKMLQFVLGYGLAAFCLMHNRPVIHCSALSINGKGIIVSGNSGAGKSTVAADLLSKGAELLGDDVIALGYSADRSSCLLYPAFPQQKLCRDAALDKGYDLDSLIYIDAKKDKFAVLCEDCFSSEPHKPDAMFFIMKYDPGAPEYADLEGRLSFIPLKGFDKVAMLKINLFLTFMLKDSGLSAETFQLMVDASKDCDMTVIYRPDGRDTLNEITEYIQKKAGR